MQKRGHGLSTDPISWETHGLVLGVSHYDWNTNKISHKIQLTWEGGKKEEKKRQYKGSVEQQTLEIIFNNDYKEVLESFWQALAIKKNGCNEELFRKTVMATAEKNETRWEN